MSIKELMDLSVSAKIFNIAGIYDTIFAEGSEFHEYKLRLSPSFKPSEIKKILQSIVRFSFFIEPVKQPKIDSTKFAVRWGNMLANNDPRKTSFEECNNIFKKLLNDLLDIISDSRYLETLKVITNHGLISYDINIDYLDRRIGEKIHVADNISFFWGESLINSFKLRKFLLDTSNHNNNTFFKEIYKKIRVKSFLTDRVLTGEHKTNREKRWECHPNSVHFAFRKECLLIEAKLIVQVCNFHNFPTDTKEILIDAGIISTPTDIMRCPITLEPLSYRKLNEEVINPIQGRSSFQVGHLHPLKSILDNEYTGHTADNISWVSMEGNRIQGDLSINETHDMIFKIIHNYKDVGLIR